MKTLSTLTSVLASAALLVAPVVSLPSAAAAPRPVEPQVVEVDLPDESTTSAFDVPDGTSLMGVTWDGGEVPGVEVRTLTDGEWSAWADVTPSDDGPDPGTAEAARAEQVGALGTDPVDVEGVDRVEVRTDATAGAGDVAAALVDPGESPADAALTPSEPAASADAAVASPQIISRKQWGADESLRGCTPDYASTVKGVVIHHTADRNTYTATQAAGMVRSIYAYHTQVRGWCDVGYNVLVDRYGQIYEGRAGGLDRAVVGAHAGGFNTGTWGVSVIGNFDVADIPKAAQDAVASVVAWKLDSYDLDPEATMTLTSGGSPKYSAGTVVKLPTIAAHRNVGLTACPGSYFYDRLGQVRSAAAAAIDQKSSAASPLMTRWRSLGGDSSVVGPLKVAEHDVRSGRRAVFERGEMFWGSSVGAREIHGSILGRYTGLGGASSVLGLPNTDEMRTPGGSGAYNHFEKGSIYWSKGTGAYSVRGSIRDRWAAMGWERSAVGFPTTDEWPTPGGTGAFNHFEKGSIYWSKGTGVYSVRGSIRDRWAAMGWERSAVGFPTTDEWPTPGGIGAFNHFQYGSIYWSPSTGVWPVRGSFRVVWSGLGWEGSRLGFPTSDEYMVGSVLRQDFQGGRLELNRATDVLSVIYR